MGSILQAIVLGIVQGLTEFLPVSSSGHLEIAKVILGADHLPKESLLLTVVLHFATALSTIVIFRKDIVALLSRFFSFSALNEAHRFVFQILCSMLPAVIVGLCFEKQLEALFSGSLFLVGLMLLLTAVLLLLASMAKDTQKPVSNFTAFVIGLAQAVAMLPGISRSGATISTAVLFGIDKTKAARFSFLMVLPLIFGKIAKDLLSGDLDVDRLSLQPELIYGFIAAFVSGVLACSWMIRLVANSKLKYFAIYCALAGVLALSFGM